MYSLTPTNGDSSVVATATTGQKRPALVANLNLANTSGKGLLSRLQAPQWLYLLYGLHACACILHVHMHVGACALGGIGMILSFSDCFFFWWLQNFVEWMLLY